MNNTSRIAVGLMLAVLARSASAALSASVDRDQLAAGESLQLTLQRSGDDGGEPDLSPLKNDFDVLTRSSGSNIQIVNGQVSAQREIRLTLAPKHSGAMQIPSLSWDGDRSPAIDLTVSGSGASNRPGATATRDSSHTFLTTSLETKQPYVQSAEILTVRLHTDQPISQASLDLAGNGDVLIEQIGKDRQSTEMRNGRRFDVVERQYLLQPQRSGQVSLDGPTLDAQIADSTAEDPFGADPFFDNAFGGHSPFAGMMNATRPFRFHGDAIDLTVRPRPANVTARNWIPSDRVTLDATWHSGNTSIHAGDPVTLDLHLSAEGLAANQLPDLSTQLSLPDGIKPYPDQATLDTQIQSGHVIGTRDQRIALIASGPGHYSIPAMHLSWWDSMQDVQREVVVPEHPLDILPAVGSANTAPLAALPSSTAAAPPIESGQSLGTPSKMAMFGTIGWRWIILSLGLLWFGTIGAWLLLRKRSTAAPAGLPPHNMKSDTSPKLSISDARQAFHEACRNNQAHAARRNLLHWTRAAWQSRPPGGLNAVASRLDDLRLKELLEQLDRACYCGGFWNGEPLARALKSLPNPAITNSTAPELAALYPSTHVASA